MIFAGPIRRAAFAGILVGLAIAVDSATARAGNLRGPDVTWAFVRFLPPVPGVTPSAKPGAGPDEIIRPDLGPGAPSGPAGQPPAGLATTPASQPSVPGSGAPPATAVDGVSDGAPPASPPPSPGSAPSPEVSPSASPTVGSSDSQLEPLAPAPAPRRPRFDVAVAMGGSFDGSGLVKGRTVLAPAFMVQGSVGDGPIGFSARLWSTQASGRFHQMCNGVSDMAADRLAVDVMVALRPFASGTVQDTRWTTRFLRALALNVGASGENASVGPRSGFRMGVVLGAHFDLPITSAGDANELRVRLGARRMVGGEAVAGAVTVSDTVADLFGGLALGF